MPEADKLLVIIPAFNEEAFIGPVVRKALAHCREVLVVDDGSLDGTAGVAARSGARVISHPERRGKGSALKTGFTWASGRDYPWILTLDGDGQHDPDDIPSLLSRLREGDAAMVVGRRAFTRANMPLDRFLTNLFTSRVVSLLCGQRLFDSQCGFRAFSARVLPCFSFSTAHFDTESEMLVEARRAGHRIAEAPVKTIYGREKSKQQPVRGTLRFFRFCLRQAFLALRPRRRVPGK